MCSIILHFLTIALILTHCQANQPIILPNSPPTQCFIPCQYKEQENSQRPTRLTFYIEQNIQQSEDFIQMSLKIKEKDPSLKKAIDKATRKIQQIKTVCIEYCRKQKGKNCEKIIDVDNYDVQASYQFVRRQPIYNGFVVTHDITITVEQTQNLGQLVDILLSLGVYQIQQLQWKPNVQIDTIEKAVDSGVFKAKQLCKHINKRMGAILSISELPQQQQQQQKKQQDANPNNSQEEQDQQKPKILKFQVECIGTAEKQEKTKEKSKKKTKEK